MKHYLLNRSNLQPKLVASFADLGQSHPKTLRLTSLSRWEQPCQLGPFNQQQPVCQLGHELELPNVVFTDFTKYDIDQPKYLFQKWSHFNSSNSLTNCYLSSKYGIDDFYQFWIDHWENSTDPFIQKLLFLNDQANQCLTNIELQQHLLTNAEFEQQLLENEAIFDLDARIANETSAQMVRQNSDWLDTSIERANAQLAEANFRVLEDRLDTSVELEISNHLHQMDWTDWALSNQIANLHKDCITPKRGGFFTSGSPEGSGGSFGNGGSGGRGFGGSSGGGRGDDSNHNPESEPPNRSVLFLFVGLSISYAIYQWFLQEFKESLEKELTKLGQEKKQENFLPAETELKQKEGRSVVALWRNRGWWQGLREGSLLVGSLLVGRHTFQRAFNLIALPRLRRVAQAFVPRFVRHLLWPLVRRVAGFGLGLALPAISQIICFFLGLDVLKRLLLVFGAPELVEPMIPIVNSIVDTVQGFFATPRGVSIAAGFLERNIKVLACSFSFGGFCNEVLIVFKRDTSKDQKFWSLICLSMYGISIYIILNDHKFIGLFVQSLIQSFPSVQQLAQRPFGQVFLIFSSGVFIQSAGFPKIVTFFYAWLLYVSGLYYSILNAN